MGLFINIPVTEVTPSTTIPLGEEGVLYTVVRTKHEGNSVTLTVRNDFSVMNTHRAGIELDPIDDDSLVLVMKPCENPLD